jgi:ribosomal protein S18 acetylase RimI-like enzyme
VTIEIREAEPAEYPEAGRVTAEAYREFARDDDGWREYLDHIADVEGRADRTTILVAVYDRRILGSATLELFDRVEPEDDPTLHPDEAHVRMVGVDPAVRRRGIARALFDRCFDIARTNGKTFVTLHTTERMTAAQRMYEAMGFSRLADRVFPDGFVLLTYRIELSPQTTVSSTAGTTSPEESSTPSSNSASMRPPRNCCS